jgi:hypothetical protein
MQMDVKSTWIPTWHRMNNYSAFVGAAVLVFTDDNSTEDVDYGE